MWADFPPLSVRARPPPQSVGRESSAVVRGRSKCVTRVDDPRPRPTYGNWATISDSTAGTLTRPVKCSSLSFTLFLSMSLAWLSRDTFIITYACWRTPNDCCSLRSLYLISLVPQHVRVCYPFHEYLGISGIFCNVCGLGIELSEKGNC